jgi:hypothetical protein
MRVREEVRRRFWPGRDEGGKHAIHVHGTKREGRNDHDHDHDHGPAATSVQSDKNMRIMTTLMVSSIRLPQ